jgi:hypothetical protein
MRRLSRVSLAAIAALALLAVPADAMAARFVITVENLTRPASDGRGGQPLSPPALVIHSSAVDVWEPRGIAPSELAMVAEDGQGAALVEKMRPIRGVLFADTMPPVINPGTRRKIVVDTAAGMDRVSAVSMLGSTNDGFTGIDSVRLGSRRLQFETIAWDAGSERNNELIAFIPGPCCGNPFVRDPEHRRIRRHPGIRGVGEVSRRLFGWKGPVARWTIRQAR